MRRLLVPLLILAVTVAATILASSANDSANPGDPPDSETADALGSPILSVRRAPEWLRRPTADGQLAIAAQQVLSAAGRSDSTCLTVHRDEVIIARNNSGTGLHPAEMQRIVTIAAIDALGAGAVFTTEVVRDTNSEILEGELLGDIWLIGGGDPVLSTSDYIGRFGDNRAFTSFEQLASNVAAELIDLGITTIVGRVVADEVKYTPSERDYESDGTWAPTDNDANVVGPLSALLVNDGYSSYPEELDATANVRATDPAVSAAALFDDLLTEAGITLTRSPVAGEQPVSADQVSIAAIDSPPLEVIAERALIDGTTAEMLFKEIGLRSGTGTQRAEASVGVFFTLAGADFPVEFGALSPVDGSGLSDLNLATCDLLVSILEFSPADSMVLDVIPDIAEGELASCAPSTDGTLVAHGGSRDKTTAVMGRFIATNGDVVTFASISNADPEGEVVYEQCNSLQRALLNAVAGHPYGPALDDLAPLAVVPAVETELDAADETDDDS